MILKFYEDFNKFKKEIKVINIFFLFIGVIIYFYMKMRSNIIYFYFYLIL